MTPQELLRKFIDYSNSLEPERNHIPISRGNIFLKNHHSEVKNLDMHDVISCGCPEWLDVGTRAEAKYIWESHRVTDDGLRVKAVKFIQQRAKDCGYDIRISKATELIKSHCL